MLENPSTTEGTSITDDGFIGHQKAVACAIVGPIVSITAYIALKKYGLELPGYITEALITLFSTLTVWLVPHR